MDIEERTVEKPVVVFGFALAALAILAVTVPLAMTFCTEWYGLLVGIGMMIAAIPAHVLGKRHPIGYGISFLLNSVGSGFSVATYYTMERLPLTVTDRWWALLPAAAVLLVTYLLLQAFEESKKKMLTVAAIAAAALLIAAVVGWCLYGSSAFSFGFFAMVLCLFYLCVFGVTVGHDERSVWRDVSYGSFGTFVIVTVVVIVVLSGGEVLDGLDGPDPDLGRGKKKPKK